MPKTMRQEPTNYEILAAINNYATKNDQRLDNIESDIKVIKSEMVTKDYLEQRLSSVVSNLVTKDYLDEKLLDLRGDLIVTVRKEDTKLIKLVDILNKRKVISKKDVNEVLSLEPFPKLSN